MSALDAPTQGHPHAYIASGEQNEMKAEALPTVNDNSMQQTIEAIPWGLHWRASVWFITLAVGLGITTDLLVYSILIPVLPFQLETLGHTGVSALTGYLLFAYSGGLVISTPPIAWLSERYKSRQWPLIVGLIILIGSQVMLMEAPAYWVMAFARVLQGIGSSVVWVVALALLCDTAPEKYVGRQLGIAMSGFSLGLLVGPPVGGALYTRFGFRGPCIFSIIFTLLDLLARLLIIERKDALRYGFDPAAILEQPLDITTTGESIHRPAADQSTPALVSSVPLSPLAVIWQLAKSLRALTALLISFVWGIAIAGLEPTLPLHLQAVWDLDSSQVGLVFVAAVVPTLFSSPLAGWWADKKGAEWATVLCIGLSLPWWCALIIRTSFALFVVIYAFQNFFSAALIAPITAELAAVTRSMPNIGYAHVYGAFNLAYGVGSTIGPIIGGQVYNHVKNGWVVLCFTFAGLFLAALGLSVVYAGEKPIFTRLMEKTRRMRPITLRGEATKDAEKPMVHVECNARLEEL